MSFFKHLADWLNNLNEPPTLEGTGFQLEVGLWVPGPHNMAEPFRVRYVLTCRCQRVSQVDQPHIKGPPPPIRCSCGFVVPPDLAAAACGDVIEQQQEEARRSSRQN